MAADNDKKTLDYGAVLADLEAKRAAIDTAIASLRALAASGALVVFPADSIPAMMDNVSVSVNGIHGGEVPTGAFLGKSIPEGAKLCLQIVKRKMTTREIAEALLKGGIETTSKRFVSILHSILLRSARSDSGIVRLDKHWGLAEWYPAGLRSGAQPQRKSKGPNRKRKAKRRAKTESEKTSKQPTGSTAKGGDSPQELIVQALRNRPESSAQDIAASTGARLQTVHLILGKLVSLGRAEKTESGKFRTAAA